MKFKESDEKPINISDIDPNPPIIDSSSILMRQMDLKEDPHCLLKPLRSSSPLKELTCELVRVGLKNSKTKGFQQLMAAAQYLQTFCYTCQNPIRERYSLSLGDGRLWHVNCLKCNECGTNLDGEFSCFARDSKIYCKLDYSRLFKYPSMKPATTDGQIETSMLANPMRDSDKMKGKNSKQCFDCKKTIQRTEKVFQCPNTLKGDATKIDFNGPLRLFHIQCFHCIQCDRLLQPGDPYRIAEAGPLCLQHETENKFSSFIPIVSDRSLEGTRRIMELGAVFENEEIKNLNCEESLIESPRKNRKRRGMLPEILDTMYENGGLFCMGNSSRQKRMRTSFKHHQLRTMKTYFAINHNPDAKDLKTLSEKTGLSKRVLQVWFQNARAKYRRSISKHDNGIGLSNLPHNTGSSNEDSGTPCLSSSVDLSGEELDDSRSQTSSTFFPSRKNQLISNGVKKINSRNLLGSECSEEGCIPNLIISSEDINEDQGILSEDDELYDEDYAHCFQNDMGIIGRIDTLSFGSSSQNTQNEIMGSEANFMHYHVM